MQFVKNTRGKPKTVWISYVTFLGACPGGFFRRNCMDLPVSDVCLNTSCEDLIWTFAIARSRPWDCSGRRLARRMRRIVVFAKKAGEKGSERSC